MRRSVLVANAAQHGSARRAGELVADVLAAHGLSVDVLPAAQVDALDRYGAVVLGGPTTRLGRWHREARRFLHRHGTTLGRRPVAVFATERHAAGRRDGAIEHALVGAPDVEPVTTARFAVGARSGGGGHDPDPDEVRRWAEELARELGA